MPTERKKPISWVWIVIAFIVFWPIGIILLLIRLGSDRSSTITCGKNLTIISYVLLAFGAMSLLVAVTGDYEAFAFAVLFLIGGIIVNRFAARTRKRGERYKQYIELIVNQNYRSIDAIASLVDVTYPFAEGELRQMIRTGYFQGASIDSTERAIIFVPSKPSVLQQSPAGPAQQVVPQVRVITCKSCGANSTVVGQFSECEYCGSTVV